MKQKWPCALKSTGRLGNRRQEKQRSLHKKLAGVSMQQHQGSELGDGPGELIDHGKGQWLGERRRRNVQNLERKDMKEKGSCETKD